MTPHVQPFGSGKKATQRIRPRQYRSKGKKALPPNSSPSAKKRQRHERQDLGLCPEWLWEDKEELFVLSLQGSAGKQGSSKTQLLIRKRSQGFLRLKKHAVCKNMVQIMQIKSQKEGFALDFPDTSGKFIKNA